MKKFLSILLIGIISLTLTGCNFGCGMFDALTGKYSTNYMNAGKYSAGNTAIEDQDTQNIRIRWYDGSVTLKASDKNVIEIEETYEGELTDKFLVHYWYSPEQTLGCTLFIEFSASGNFSLEGKSKDLTVLIPKKDYKSISLESHKAVLNVDLSDYVNTLSRFNINSHQCAVHAKIYNGGEVKISGYNKRKGAAENRILEFTALGKVSDLGIVSTAAKIVANVHQVNSMEKMATVYADLIFNCDIARKVVLGNSRGIVQAQIGAFDSISVEHNSNKTELTIPATYGFKLNVSRVTPYDSALKQDTTVTVNFDGVNNDGNTYTVGDGSKSIKVKTANSVIINHFE